MKLEQKEQYLSLPLIMNPLDRYLLRHLYQISYQSRKHNLKKREGKGSLNQLIENAIQVLHECAIKKGTHMKHGFTI